MIYVLTDRVIVNVEEIGRFGRLFHASAQWILSYCISGVSSRPANEYWRCWMRASCLLA